MNPPYATDVLKWQRVNALLQQGLELPQDQRAEWLARLAGEHPEVVAQLRVLLERSVAQSDTFMRRPVSGHWVQDEALGGPGDAPGDVIGPYRLLRALGQGGMGAVWLAERVDASPQRRVALKLPLHGWARGVIERLEQERDTLAALEHPNIARLYDAGSTAMGRPYVAMEFVDGAPIDVFAAEHHLPIRARVSLLLQVARAVSYAHGRLVVHRDLKPSNILVTADGDVRLLDFGAAKLLRDDGPQDSALTREAGRAFSPDYAAPEQIRGEPVTVSTDVYSLGVVLFELLTGTRPYSLKRHSATGLAAALEEAESPLASSIVTNPRSARRELRGDLDNIIAKALKKNVTERYATVGEFADDLVRWLHYQPVRARPDSVAYRVAKFVRRNRIAVAVGTLMVAALMAAAIITTKEMLEARTQRDVARAQAKRAQAEERFANMVLEQTGTAGHPLSREEMLDRSVELLDQQYGDDPQFIASSLIPISDRYMELGNTRKELAVLEKAESIARRLGDPVLLISVQCNAVETETDLGNIEGARRRMTEARTLLAHTAGIPMERRIECIHADATLADALGDRARAVDLIESAISLQESRDRTDRAYRALLSHAQVLYLYAGRPKDAYALVEKTLSVLEKTDAKNSEAIFGALHNQSLALNQMGEVQAALRREQEAVAISTGGDPKQPVAALAANALGRLFTRLARPRDGELWSGRAAAAAREGGNVATQIIALATLAEAQAMAGELSKARTAAEEAALRITAGSDSRARIAVERARTIVALKRNDLRGVNVAVASLLNLIGYPDPDKVRVVQSADTQLLLAARAALQTGDAPAAVRLASAALALANELAREPRHSASVGEARLLLAQAYLAQGERDSAHASLHGAIEGLSTGLAPDHPLTLEAAALEARL
ncbi:MAG TPA: serine/threonine-protein kinase [Steroidobacteraceae bacterium]|nr:serine/threonine-protein kinase [Steroidobacteraceae bacterium]